MYDGEDLGGSTFGPDQYEGLMSEISQGVQKLNELGEKTLSGLVHIVEDGEVIEKSEQFHVQYPQKGNNPMQSLRQYRDDVYAKIDSLTHEEEDTPDVPSFSTEQEISDFLAEVEETEPENYLF
jgi:hypothetical protein